MAAITLDELNRDGYEAANIKSSDEPITSGEHRTAIRLLNQVFDKWSGSPTLIAGFGRKVHDIPDNNNGAFSIGTGEGVDIDVGSRISEIMAVGYATETTVIPDLRRETRAMTIPGDTSGYGRWQHIPTYSVTYGPDRAEILFTESLYGEARKLIIDYKIELASIPVPAIDVGEPELNAILASSLEFPVGYRDMLVYGLAERLMIVYGKTHTMTFREVRMKYRNAENKVRSRNWQMLRNRLPFEGSAVIGYHAVSQDYAEFTQPGSIDTTPHEVHTKDGTVRWGVQGGTRGNTEMGSALYNYGRALTINFIAPAAGETLWIAVPLAAEATGLELHGWPQLAGWTAGMGVVNGTEMRIYTFGPIGGPTAGQNREYQLTINAA